MALWKAHSLNHSQRTTGRSSVPLEGTSSNNGAIPCLRYLREMLTCSLAVSKGQKPTGKSNCPVAATNSPRKVLKSPPWAHHSFKGSRPETWVTQRTGYIGNNFGPNGFASGSSTRVSRSKYPNHKANQPDVVVNFFDADSLASKDRAEIDFFAAQTDAAAIGDDDDFIVEGIVDIGQSLISAGRGLIDLGWALHVQGFVRTFVVEDFDEVIEEGLLLKEV